MTYLANKAAETERLIQSIGLPNEMSYEESEIHPTAPGGFIEAVRFHFTGRGGERLAFDISGQDFRARSEAGQLKDLVEVKLKALRRRRAGN
jgi:hypothetical protein